MLIHIFNTTGKRDLDLEITYDEMVKRTNEDIEGAKDLIELVNTNEKAKRAAEKILNKDYVMKDKDGNYFINDMLIKLDLFTFKLEQSIYKNGISIVKQYNKEGIITNNPEYERLEGITKAGNKITFKDAFLQYAEIKSKPLTLADTSALIKAQPLIVDAYNKLGADEVRKLRYIKKDIEAAIIKMDNNSSKELKVAKLLQNKYNVGFYSSSDIKKALTDIYKSLEIKDKVKATEIERYFDCKESVKKIDGKAVRGYELYRAKIVFR